MLHVFGLGVDRQHTVWYGTLNSICHVAGDALKCQPLPKTEHPAPPAMSFEADSGGGTWVGTWVGLFHLQDGTLTRYGNDVGLPQVPMRTVLEDGQRNLWLCTPNAILRVPRTAIDRFRKKETPTLDVETYDASHGMKSNQLDFEANVASRARDGRLWFATLGGLVVVNPAQIAQHAWVPPVKIEKVLVDGTARAVQAGSSRSSLPDGAASSSTTRA